MIVYIQVFIYLDIGNSGPDATLTYTCTEPGHGSLLFSV